MSQRDFISNVTILSGDIGVANDVTDNSYHVISNSSNITTVALLDGCTIADGNANGTSPANNGGGFYNFNNNNLTISNCTFSNNRCTNFGAGVYNQLGSVQIINCTFSSNVNANAGGGIHNIQCSSEISNCVFLSNSANSGGAVYYNNAVNSKIFNCKINGNSSSAGGGIFCSGSSPSITNCVITGNTASLAGGGIYSGSSSSPNVVNCTIAGNTATNSGGGMFTFDGTNTISNSIVWNNNTGIANYGTSATTATYCDIQGGFAGLGNINADPVFVSPLSPGLNVGGNYNLQPCSSPIINQGNNASVPVSITSDINGSARIFNGTVDMGAYEPVYYSMENPAVTANGPTSFCGAGSVTLSASGPSNCLQLNGNNQYLVTPDLVSGFASSSVTIELWFNANAAGVILSENGQPTVNTSWHNSQLEVPSNGHVYARVWNLVAVDLGVVSFGTWHHVALRYNSSTQLLDGFLDGVASTTSSGGRSMPSNIYYAFGATDNTNLGSGNYFNGKIDEIRIWNSALSNTLITQNYQSSIPSNAAGLVAYYRLNETSGTTAYDFTGRNKNASTVNSPVWDNTSGAALSKNYLWSNGSTGSSITVSASNSYSVQVTDENGCVKTSNAITVSSNPYPAIELNPAYFTCNGTSFPLDAGTFSTFQWSTGETTQTINTTNTGTFTVSVTDNNGCTASASTVISLYPAPSGGITTNIGATNAVAHWNSGGILTPYYFEKRAVGDTTFDQGWIVWDTLWQMKNMLPNTQYEWHVSAICEDLNHSDWSPLVQFTTGNIPCTNTPTGLNVTNITTTSAKLKWTAMSPTPDKYVLRYRVSGNNPWTTIIGSGSAIQKTIYGLIPATSYQWQIRGRCGTSVHYDFSSWSAISTFTTLTSREGMIAVEMEASVYPNPTNGMVSLSLPECENCTYKVTMLDILGNIVSSKEFDQNTELINIDYSFLPKAIYSMCIDNGESRKVLKIVIQ